MSLGPSFRDVVQLRGEAGPHGYCTTAVLPRCSLLAHTRFLTTFRVLPGRIAPAQPALSFPCPALPTLSPPAAPCTDAGGIQRYLEAFPSGGFFRGANFVFDERGGVDSGGSAGACVGGWVLRLG